MQDVKIANSNYAFKRTCMGCGTEFRTNRKRQLYCTNSCRYTIEQSQFVKHRLDVPPSTLGALTELSVCADLLAKGYEVFRAQSPSCSCDLIASKDGELLRVEVRTGHINAMGELRASAVGDRTKCDVLAVVAPDMSIVYTKEVEINSPTTTQFAL